MFTVLSTIIFMLLTFAWRSDDVPNLIIKTALGLMTGWGGYLIYTFNLLG